MMKAENVIDYVNEYQYSFRERPFSEVDSLVLSQIVYFKMKGLIPTLERQEDFVPFSVLMEEKNHKKLFRDKRYRKDNMALAFAVLGSRRYQNLALNYHIDILDKVMEIQFSAITFRLEDDLYYVAYRGTDENLVGWKEDLFLAFSEPGLGQLYSAKYLEKAAVRIPCDFYVGGHSKGGNLATFSVMCASPSLQNRIKAVFSHDGPGMKQEVQDRYHYDAIADKVQKTIPKASLVGMLMENSDRCQIVASNRFGLGQHNPYMWKIRDGQFVSEEKLTGNALLLKSVLNDWISSLEDEQIHLFADLLFQVLEASESDNLIDFAADWKKSLAGIYQALKELEPDRWEEVDALIKSFLEAMRESTRTNLPLIVEEEIADWQNKIRQDKSGSGFAPRKKKIRRQKNKKTKK